MNRILALVAALPTLCLGTDFTLSLYGNSRVYQGYQAYTRIEVNWDTAMTNPFPIMFNSITPSTSGLTASLWCSPSDDSHGCAYQSSTGRWYYQDPNTEPYYFRLKIGADQSLAPGNYTIDVEVELYCGSSASACTTAHKSGAVWHTISIPITVVAVSALSTTPLPEVATPIPGIAGWDHTAQYIGDNFCTWHPEAFCFSASCSQVWFYDGAKVYYDLASRDTENAAKWTACGTWVASQYADWIVGGGGLWGFQKFPRGMELAYLATGQSKYNSAIHSMGGGTSSVMNDYYIRETAYGLQSNIADQKLGSNRSAIITAQVESIVAAFDMYFHSRSGYHMLQTFMAGLAAAALIEWYDYSGTYGHWNNAGVLVAGRDERIPLVIREMLDWYWDYGRNGSNQIVWNPNANVGHVCGENETMCCGTESPDSCQAYAPELQALSVHAFGWYYSLTGNTTYRDRGDALFLATPRNYRATFSSSTDRVTVVGHGWANGTRVQWYRDLGGRPQPTGAGGAIWSNQDAYVVDPDTDTFKVSLTPGGAAIDITSDGTMYLKKYTDYYLPEKGKIFSQNYKYGLDYVLYRSATQNSPGEPSLSTGVSGTVEVGGTVKIEKEKR